MNNNITDQLGNIRMVFNHKGEILQENHYYPFGMVMNGIGTQNSNNPYFYNGKELQDLSQFYDYGFRQLDPQLGRWFCVDKLSEWTVSVSPYAYVSNNPINHYDILGLVEGQGTNQDGSSPGEPDDRTPTWYEIAWQNFLDFANSDSGSTGGSYGAANTGGANLFPSSSRGGYSFGGVVGRGSTKPGFIITNLGNSRINYVQKNMASQKNSTYMKFTSPFSPFANNNLYYYDVPVYYINGSKTTLTGLTKWTDSSPNTVSIFFVEENYNYKTEIGLASLFLHETLHAYLFMNNKLNKQHERMNETKYIEDMVNGLREYATKNGLTYLTEVDFYTLAYGRCGTGAPDFDFWDRESQKDYNIFLNKNFNGDFNKYIEHYSKLINK